MNSKYRLTKPNYYRKPLQWAVSLLLVYMVFRLWISPEYIADFEAYCPYGGMLALGSLFVNNSLACSMTSLQIAMGIALIAGVILFSKLFCSAVCPVGTFTEWLGRIGDRLHVRYTISGIADRFLRTLKYALLFATLYFTLESSELFCRKFDPYYAAFTGFGHDVVLLYAIPALAIVVLGSVFVRQFWCLYLCPLGATTNLFTNIIAIAGIAGILILLSLLGIQVNWIWIISTILAAGFLLESFKMKGLFFPSLKIKRIDNICSGCGECDKICPMAIRVSEAETVTHIDCHLCTDCIDVCPDSDALTINKRKMQWAPPAATVALIAGGLFLGTAIEFPTINLRWGDDAAFAEAAVFSQSGLQSIKCYGSSMSFASQMENLPGVLGVETYVSTHTVKVFYDPTLTSPRNIKEAIFTPVQYIISIPKNDDGKVSSVTIGIDKLFDSYDHFQLESLLEQKSGIYAMETSFGEPVRATIYYDPGKITPQEIKNLIESKEIPGMTATIPLNYSIAFMDKKPLEIGSVGFKQKIFTPFDMTFNSWGKYDSSSVSIYEIPFPQSVEPSMHEMLPYLVSHLSDDTSFVRFETKFSEKIPVARIYYVSGKTDGAKILNALRKDSLYVLFDEGETRNIYNPFRFPNPGKIISLGKYNR